MNQVLVTQIVEQLVAHADPKRAVEQRAYMKNALEFLGVRVPQVRRLTHTACKDAPCTSFKDFKETILHLFFEARYQEHRYAAVGVCTFRGHDKFQTFAALPLYRKLITTAAWWDIVDELSHRVGLLLDRYPKKMRPVLKKWSQDDNIWLRRTAIIAQVGFKQRVDLDLLFTCIEPSLDHKEFFVRKAIGWALRDVAWTNPDATRAYVQTHAKRLSALSQREALKNLTGKMPAPNNLGSNRETSTKEASAEESLSGGREPKLGAHGGAQPKNNRQRV